MSSIFSSLADSLRDLAGQVNPDQTGKPQPIIKRQAYVTAIDWTGKTVSIQYPEASTAIDGVAFVGSYSPFVNDTVWVEENGNDRLVTGTAASGGTDPPTGTVVAWPSSTPPSGWLVCNGASVPSQYTALIAFIGSTLPNISTGATNDDLPSTFRWIIHV